MKLSEEFIRPHWAVLTSLLLPACLGLKNARPDSGRAKGKVWAKMGLFLLDCRGSAPADVQTFLGWWNMVLGRCAGAEDQGDPLIKTRRPWRALLRCMEITGLGRTSRPVSWGCHLSG